MSAVAEGVSIIEGALPADVRRRAWCVLALALAPRLALAAWIIADRGGIDALVDTQDGQSNLQIAASFPWVYRGTDQLMHFPGYPFAIWLASALVPPGWAAVAISIVTSSLAVACTYLIGYRLGLGEAAWRGAVLFCVLPVRWLDVSLVAMSEGLTIAALCSYVYAVVCARPGWAALAFAVATLCRFGSVFVVPFGLVFLLHRDGRRFAHACVAAASGAGAVLALCTYFHFAFGNFFLYFETHGRLWGGSHLDWPGRAWIAGLSDPTLAGIRKVYVGALLVFYFGVAGLALKDARRSAALRVLGAWFALAFVPLAILNGASINWGFIAFPRWVLPATPPTMLMLGYVVPQRWFKPVAIAAVLVAVAYVVWAARTPHSYYELDPGPGSD